MSFTYVKTDNFYRIRERYDLFLFVTSQTSGHYIVRVLTYQVQSHPSEQCKETKTKPTQWESHMDKATKKCSSTDRHNTKIFGYS